MLVAILLSGCVSAPKPRVAPEPGPAPRPSTSMQRWYPIGTSVERRQLLVAQAGTGPVRVYVIGGIHGDETEGRSLLEALKNQPNAAATLRILRDANPDGTAARRRSNARGYDLNRNWPATNFTPGAAGHSGRSFSRTEVRLRSAE